MNRTKQISVAIVVSTLLAVGYLSVRFLNNRLEYSRNYSRASAKMAEMLRAKKLDPECLMDVKRISRALEKSIPSKDDRDRIAIKLVSGTREISLEIVEEVQPNWIAGRTYLFLQEEAQGMANWWQRAEHIVLSNVIHFMRRNIWQYHDYELVCVSSNVRDFIYGPEVSDQMGAIERVCRRSNNL